MTSPLPARPPRVARPHLVVLKGGRASTPAPFVVAPPAVLEPARRHEAQVRADRVDLIRCHRLAGRLC